MCIEIATSAKTTALGVMHAKEKSAMTEESLCDKNKRGRHQAPSPALPLNK